MKHRIALLSSAVLLGSVLSAAALSGTKTIGPTGDYISIGTAIADIQAQGLDGPLVLELQAAYVSSVETFPLTFPSLNGAGAVNTVTVRPASGATNLSISSADTTAATVDLNGAQFLTIDGRPGGLGTTTKLSIANISTAGVALRFINEASSNTIKYTTLQGVNTGATSGTVVFSTTTGANGNDNNTIDHCDIRDGASTPANGVYALGTATTPAQNNSGNTISNSNIFNFYSPSAIDTAGVRLDDGNTDWTLMGNSFYQTAGRSAVAASVRAIYVNNAFGNNFTVAGNFIGGSGANAGSTAWATTGTSSAYQFVAIQLAVGISTFSSVQGNTVQNFIWTSSSNLTASSGVWCGIYIFSGSANVGTVTGNTIGSGSGTGSVSVTTSGNGGTTFGIGSASGGTVAITNNTIGSITVNGSSTSVSASLTGIQVTAGTNTISNNIVGSATTANSLNAVTACTSGTAQRVTGILSSSPTSASITGNTMANLNNNYVGASVSGQIRGIVASAGLNNITGNTIRNVSTTSPNAAPSTLASVLGIIDTSATAGQTVSQNVVHSLSNTAVSAGVSVTGIYYSGNTTTGPNVIAGNLVHSLSVASTSASSELIGMLFNAGTFTSQNNMVRIGLDASGVGTAGASFVVGVYDVNSTAGRNFYHNSVYLGGTQTSGAQGTYAFQSGGTTNARTFQNNIFVNARSNSGGTGKHYAITYGTTVNPTGLAAGGNLFLASGTGGVLGLYYGDRTTLAAWQAATGQDASSAVADPLFVNPTGTAATVDLHLQTSNPAEGGGIPIAAVTDDVDGQTRSTLTPVDVGADAGNFIENIAPAISYPLLTSGNTSNRTVTGWATISDNVGVSGGASAPRLYYKRSTDADAFGVANNSTGNGWKYVTASNSTSPYSFTIDYTLVNGGSVSSGNTIQYFVVAQDAANNLSSSPAGATASGNPPVQTVNSHGAVKSFSIVGGTINSTVTVGSGGTYPSLSGAGGLFAALNGAVLTGNVVVNIASDLTETGGVMLNGYGSNNYPFYTVTIQPDSATMRTISGSVANGLITLNGADRVTIDGRFGGSGRYLTFRNTNAGSNASTLLFINDASDNTVRSCIFEGATTNAPLGVIGFSTGAVTGNDNNLITGCQVRDLSTAAGVPYALIGSGGSSADVANSNNTLSNNELFNFRTWGVVINSTSNESWTISGNNIYEATASDSILVGISLNCGGVNAISGNLIHDLAPTTGGTSIGIDFVNNYALSTTTISGNRITFVHVNSTPGLLYGIRIGVFALTTLRIANNQITLIPTPTANTAIYGLSAGTSGISSVINTFYNTVLIGGTASGSSNSWANWQSSSNTAWSGSNNIFFNFRTGGSGSHFAAGRSVIDGSYNMNYNVYAGTGATPSSFMDTGVGVTFATWQSSTGGDANSSAGNPGGNFTTAMFVDAANGDLHLVPAGNPLVSDTGTPVSGVTTDYGGEARGLVAPDIGADELISTNATLSGLALSSGLLSPAFDPNALAYTTTVSNATTAMNVTPIKAEPNAAVTVNSTSPATPVALNIGPNTITVFVTAQDLSTTKTYTVTVTRRTVFQDWAVANSVSNAPLALGANGVANLLNFAFGVNPGGASSGGLQFTGDFTTGGMVSTTGLPITRLESSTNGTDVRALFVRRADYVSAGLTYTVEFTGNLTAWQDSTDVPTVLADDGTNQIVSVPFPTALNASGFFRLRVSLP